MQEYDLLVKEGKKTKYVIVWARNAAAALNQAMAETKLLNPSHVLKKAENGFYLNFNI